MLGRLDRNPSPEISDSLYLYQEPLLSLSCNEVEESGEPGNEGPKKPLSFLSGYMTRG